MTRRHVFALVCPLLVGAGCPQDQSPLVCTQEELGGVEHGGGDKFHTVDDEAYVDILYWIEREADCASP